jgi:MFS transporter, ACDE family, multidrug resistance protein
MGIGAAGLINLAIVLIGDFWDGDDRTRLIGRNSVVLTIGIALVPPLGGAITELVSWRAALSIYGVALLTAFAAHRLLDGTAPSDVPPLRAQLGDLGRAVRDPRLMVVYIGGMVAFTLIFGIFLAALPIHLEDQFGYGAAIRGLFLSLPALSSMTVAFNIAAIRRRIAAKQLLAMSALALAAAFALMGASTLAVLVVAGCLFHGVGEGAMIPTLQDLSVSLAPPGQRGAVVALFVASTRLGQTIGPLGAAALFEATSTSLVLRVGALLALGLATLFVFAPTVPQRSPATQTAAER